MRPGTRGTSQHSLDETVNQRGSTRFSSNTARKRIGVWSGTRPIVPWLPTVEAFLDRGAGYVTFLLHKVTDLPLGAWLVLPN